MSTATSAPQGQESIGARIDSTEKQLVQLQQALRTARTTSLILAAGLLGLVILTVWLFGSLGKQLTGPAYQQALMTEARGYLEKNQDEYTRQARAIIEKSLPVVKQAVLDQTKKDSTLYVQALHHQREELLKNLQGRLEDQLNRKHEETLAQMRQVLASEFPEAADPQVQEKLVANMQIALQKLVKEHYSDRFRTELTEMYDTWDGFPVAQAPEKGEVPLEQQLVGSLIDLMVMKAASNQQLVVDAAANAAPAQRAPAGSEN